LQRSGREEWRVSVRGKFSLNTSREASGFASMRGWIGSALDGDLAFIECTHPVSDYYAERNLPLTNHPFDLIL
jgi:hypothetical protein